MCGLLNPLTGLRSATISRRADDDADDDDDDDERMCFNVA